MKLNSALLLDACLLYSDHLPLHLGEFRRGLLISANEKSSRPKNYDGRRGRETIFAALLILSAG
ncbi:hypothetical protein [Bradyrhizobium jicamae]|uniref:hypothetical protein n=1 Tax=Bradyrhizobium jicamae TaxID=280332 RepID=UPI0012ED317C|nr:hypothetical protein [Bradyrhizobium jicamae]